MATDFIMPRLPDPQQQSAFFQPPPQVFPPLQQPAVPLPTDYQAAQQHYNPQISPLSTPGNGSPTSPKTYLTRQTRPMYMPAVLRPTEFPSKAPIQRPKQPAEGDDADDRALRPNSSYLSLSALSALGRLSRRSTGDSGKCVDGDWNLELFSKPTGDPTKRHWKPDAESIICDDATCKRYFSYFTRRHHCRKCGNIFCDTHSSFEIPLDQEANYNPRAAPSRACRHCFSEFREWRRSRTNSQASSLDSSTSADGALHHGAVTGTGSGSNSPTPTSPSPIVAGSPTSVLAKGGVVTQGQEGMSVPRDWSWSTF